MANPYLPNWEYIPDGEPRVFGDRIYVYGSHDRVGSDCFCDYKLKVWSAPLNNLNQWVCHGDAFKTRSKSGENIDVDYSGKELYAPDVVEKDGKYYLYAYILESKGCVAVSDRPEGPFEFISTYKYDIKDHYDNGTFIDPGVLVDDDGRVYVYCGFLGSYMCELNPENMYEVINETYLTDIIPVEEPFEFFEACSPRKIGNTYYLIYSPKNGNRLAYATADSPRGPFTYRGYIVSNGEDYPGGNDHGSIVNIKGQWYIFYHRMTDGSITSRRACVEKINVLPDGSIPTVEMTSLGFEESLNPYNITPAETACVLKGNEDLMITEYDIFTRPIINIKEGSIFGWKYFDFGEDYTKDDYMYLALNIIPRGCYGKVQVFVDEVKDENLIGELDFNKESKVVKGKVKKLTGRHAIYMKVVNGYKNWCKDLFANRDMFDFLSFVFMK
ncbi:MAG: family 43 glycosylhydrolase [Lachnospiraceae bacterium]|nr:family 43 glycosylhydrolase [Lachnospiraceae bacterium]